MSNPRPTKTRPQPPRNQPQGASPRLPNQRKPRSRKGIPNRRYKQVLRSDSRCPSCHSSARTKFYRKRSYKSTGQRDGIPFNSVVMRYCTCTACGTARCEVTHELL